MQGKATLPATPDKALSQCEKCRLCIGPLPADLSGARDELEKDDVVKESAVRPHPGELPPRQEWQEHISHVHPWKQERHLGEY